MKSIKIVVVGDGAVGKTCFCLTYTGRSFPKDYIPTVFDNYSANIEYQNTKINLGLWETMQREDSERLRPLSYPQTDCFIVCFSIVQRPTFENVFVKWIPEVTHHCPNVAIVIVGMKIDIRDDPEAEERFRQKYGASISYEEAAKRVQISAPYASYIECSSLAGIGVDDVIYRSIDCVLGPNNSKKDRKSRCALQ